MISLTEYNSWLRLLEFENKCLYRKRSQKMFYCKLDDMKRPWPISCPAFISKIFVNGMVKVSYVDVHLHNKEMVANVKRLEKDVAANEPEPRNQVASELIELSDDE